MENERNVTFYSVESLQSEIWQLEHTVNKINTNYHDFSCDLSWSKYGEVQMLKKSMNRLADNLKDLLAKIEKGD